MTFLSKNWGEVHCVHHWYACWLETSAFRGHMGQRTCFLWPAQTCCTNTSPLWTALSRFHSFQISFRLRNLHFQILKKKTLHHSVNSAMFVGRGSDKTKIQEGGAPQFHNVYFQAKQTGIRDCWLVLKAFLCANAQNNKTYSLCTFPQKTNIVFCIVWLSQNLNESGVVSERGPQNKKILDGRIRT